MEESREQVDLEALNDYFFVFGSIGHYLKRAVEFHESRKSPEPLPPRWLHLAERSIVRSPYPRYEEFAVGAPRPAALPPQRVAKIDSVVVELNSLLSREGVLAAFRQPDSPELAELARLYKALRHAVYGVKDGAANAADPTELKP